MKDGKDSGYWYDWNAKMLPEIKESYTDSCDGKHPQA